MEFITFKQFIYTICVRYYNEDIPSKHDSRVIRLYWKDQSCNWIDIGWYDFDGKDSVWNRLALFLNEKVLNSIVVQINMNYDLNELEVWLEEREDFEDLDAYAN